MIFNSCSNIDSVTNTSIRGTVLRSCVASNDAARGNADPNLNLDLILRSLLEIKSLEQLNHLKRCSHGMFTVIVMGNGGAEKGHQAVSLQLIDSSMVTDNGFKHQSKIV